MEKFDIENQRRHFDKISAKYQAAIEKSSHVIISNKIWEELFSQLPPNQHRTVILDAMCGACYLYKKINMFFPGEFDYSGFDYSKEMVSYARAKHPGIKIWEQDITTFIAPDKYDVIAINGGLHHVHAHLDTVLNNIYSSLKPNGIFVSLEPTHNNIFFGLVRSCIYKTSALFDQDTEKGFNCLELTNTIKSHGFVLEKQFFPGLFGYVLWYLPGLIHPIIIGAPNFIKKYIDWEKRFWSGRVAKFFSFATASLYRKLEE